MNRLTSRQIFDAFDEALEVGSRWPQLVIALDLKGFRGWPGPRLLNNALRSRGFRPVVDETLALEKLLSEYPESWWYAIAEEVTGRRDATVLDVTTALRARTPAQSAQ